MQLHICCLHDYVTPDLESAPLLDSFHHSPHLHYHSPPLSHTRPLSVWQTLVKVWSGEEVILQQCTKIMIKKVSLFLKVLHCSGTLLSSLPSLISDTQIPINFSCPWNMRYFFTTRGFPEVALLLDLDKRSPSSGHCALEELVPHL